MENTETNNNSYEYDFSDINPIDFNLEKKLINEIEDFLLTTKDLLTDWKKREISLRKLGGIIKGNQGHNPLMIRFFNQKINVNLITQMSDLRTSVMKIACKITSLCAKELGISIENSITNMVTKYILYKQVGSSNKVISDNSSKCIYHLIKFIQTSKMLINVCDQINNKSNNIRASSANHLIFIVGNYKPIIINKNRQLIEDTMKFYLSDSNGEVRFNARKIYFVYKKRFPDNAGIFFNLLDRNIQKQILEDEKNGISDFIKNYNEILNREDNGNFQFGNYTINRSSNLKTNKSSVYKTSKTLNDSNNYTLNNRTRILSSFNKSPTMEENSISKNLINSNIYYSNNMNKKKNKNNNKNNENNNDNNNDDDDKDIDDNNNNYIVNNERYNKSKSPKSPKIYKRIPVSNPKSNAAVLKNLNSKLEQLKILSEGYSKNKNIQELKEKTEDKIINNINKIESTDITEKKAIFFQYFYNDFTNILNEINLISKQTIKNMIDIHIENLTESDKNLISQILKNLMKMIFYMKNIFNDYDISTIVKLTITHISSKDSSLIKLCNQLLEIIRKKSDNVIIFKSIFELLKDGDCEEDVCYEILSLLIPNCNGLINNQEEFKQYFSIICNAFITNNSIKNFLEILYKNNKESFTYCFDNENRENQKKMLMLLEENKCFFIKNLKYNDFDLYNEYENKKREKKNEMEMYEEINNNIMPKVSDVINLKEKENSNIVPEEIVNSIKLNDFELFLNYMTNHKSYIPQFFLLMNNMKYNKNNNAISLVNFTYGLLSSPIFIIDLNASMQLMINQIINLLITNSTNNNLVEGINELFNIIPFRLNTEKYFKIINKYLTTGNDELLLQILILNIKNFVINNKEKDLNKLLPSFIYGIFNMLNHQSNEIRKMAVDCSVEVYLIVGYKFESFLTHLSQSHQNLIKLFIKKKTGN